MPKVDHLEVVERGDSRRYANQLVVVYLPSYCDHHDLLSDLDQHNGSLLLFTYHHIVIIMVILTIMISIIISDGHQQTKLSF